MELKSALNRFMVQMTALSLFIFLLFGGIFLFYFFSETELTNIHPFYMIIFGMILVGIPVLQFLLVKRLKKIIFNNLATQKEFNESERKYESIIENIQIGVARTTPGEKGKHIEVNSWLAIMLGYSKEELKNIPVADLYLDDKKRKIFSNKISRFDIVRHEELKLCKKDGSIIIVSAAGQAVRDKNGKVKYFDLILEDITDEKYSQEEFLKSEKLKSIGTLAGGIAHDFNNILTGLYGNIALAKLELTPEDEAFQLIQDAEQSMTKATDLTQQLLTFARGGDPIKEPITIGQIVKEAASFNLSGSNIKLIMSVDDQLWRVHADKGQIGLVTSNLVINARHAMPEGGNLRIAVQNIRIAENELKPLSSGKYIKIIIQDEGIGISRDYIAKIFDPYFTTKQTGCGMGLSTAYSILKKHNGLITVSSRIGNGASFCLYLPALEKDKKPSSLIEPKVQSNVKSANILIMDDDEQVCNIAKKMIQKFEFKATAVSEGRQAISIYKQALKDDNAFDLILMDLTIPGGMGGKETISKILEIDPNARAVVISGYSNDPVLSNYKDYGFKGMLVKPFRISELREILDKVLK